MKVVALVQHHEFASTLAKMAEGLRWALHRITRGAKILVVV